ncbi:MAG: tetratricopeptide repeat protein [Planctomycetaceae bacterium]
MSTHRLYSIPAIALPVLLVVVSSGNTAVGQSTISAAGIKKSMFQSDPQSPDKLLTAARLAQRQDRVTEARRFLAMLLERDPQTPEMVALRQQNGMSPFILMRVDRRLQPEASDLLMHMQAAVPGVSQTEMEQAVSRLAAGNSAAQQATVLLLSAGEKALPTLLAADVQTNAGKAAEIFLEEYCRDYRGGLLELLDTIDPASQTRIIRLLAGSDSPDVAEHLIRWQYLGTTSQIQQAAKFAVDRLSKGRLSTETPAQAVSLLLRLAESALITAANDSHSTQSDLPVPEIDVRLSPPALTAAGNRLSVVDQIDPGNAQAALLGEILLATVASPSPLARPGELESRSAAELLAILDKCVQLKLTAAALETLRSLGIRDLSTKQLAHLETALNAAVQHPDARLRIAAVMQLQGRNLPLNSSARRQLVAIQTGRLRPEAVVIGPDDRFRLQLRYLLEDQGFSVAEEEIGPDGFETAAAQMRCELIFLSLTPARWPASVTLGNLRADLRTTQSPIVLIGPSEKRAVAEALAAAHPNVHFLSTPIGELTFPAQIKSLNLPDPQLSEQDRAYLQSQVR